MPASAAECRVITMTPTGRDEELARSILLKAGIESRNGETISQVCRLLDEGAGALLIAEETIATDRDASLLSWLAQQPTWSDLPVLILSRPGADSAVVSRGMEQLGNVTVLERPTRVAALVSSIRSALRARQKQYQIRDHLLERAAAEESLRDADRRKDEFLAMLAHELRNPLAPIRNSLHILSRSTTDDVRQRAYQIVERQVNTLVRLVDDLMDVSRVSRGKVELKKQAVSLADVLRDAITTSRPLIDTKTHELIVETCPQALVVDGDPVRLTQVFSNLLNNAAKYTSQRGRLEVLSRHEPPFAVISVKDNGMGLSAEMLPRVFDLFTQAKQAREVSHGGLGIGLTLVRSLVEMHGGTVEAHSSGLKRGSEFTVRLPLIESDVPDVDSSIRSISAGGIPRHRVLVVDDNVDAAESLAMLLRMLGAEVVVKFNGPDALTSITDSRPDVIFLDIGMPGMNGYEVARTIRQSHDLGGVTLIALTGWGQTEDRRRSLARGFNFHVVKPPDIACLESILVSIPMEKSLA